MNKTKIGIILLILGVIGLVTVYSLRPISLDGDHKVSEGEAMYMSMVLGRSNWIREPQYQIYMALSGLISVIGVIQIVAGMRGGKKQQPDTLQQTKETHVKYCSKCGTHQALEEATFCGSCGAAVVGTASSLESKAAPQATAVANNVTGIKATSLNSKLHITLICAAGIAVILLYTTKLMGLIAMSTGVAFGLCLQLFFSHQKSTFAGTSKLDWVLLVVASGIAFVLMYTEGYDIQAILLIFVAVRSLMMYFTMSSND